MLGRILDLGRVCRGRTMVAALAAGAMALGSAGYPQEAIAAGGRAIRGTPQKHPALRARSLARSLLVYDPRTGKLSDLGLMPYNNEGFTVVAASDQLFFLGGMVYAYQPGVGWVDKAAMPSPAGWLSTGVVDGTLYAADYDDAHLRVYDIENDTWSQGPGKSRTIIQGAVDGKLIFLDSNPGGSRARLFDPATGEWTGGGERSGPSRSLSVGVFNGKFYAISAAPQAGRLYVYHPYEDRWVVEADVPAELLSSRMEIGFVGSSSNAHLYAMIDDREDLHLELWRYPFGEAHTTRGEWTREAEFGHLMSCRGMQVLDGKIYFTARLRPEPQPPPPLPSVPPESLAGVDPSVRSAMYAYAAYPGGMVEGVGIFVASADGSIQRRLTSQGVESGIAFSRDGRRIAFVGAGGSGAGGIYAVDVDGSGLVRVTDRPGLDSSPSWSPDGGSIVFSGYATMGTEHLRNWEVYKVRLGEAPVRLTYTEFDNTEPRWSPDGTQVAFLSKELSYGGHPPPGATQLWNMYEDGSGQVLLAEGVRGGGRPGGFVWSPDSSRIAYVTGQGYRTRIHVVNADGTGDITLAPDLGDIACPSWSPDGKRIAFLGPARTEVPRSVYTTNSDGTGLQVLAEHPPAAFVEPIRWLRSDKILYLSLAEGLLPGTMWPEHYTIYGMDSDGKNVSKLSYIRPETVIQGLFTWAP